MPNPLNDVNSVMSPATSALAITPEDDNDLAQTTRGIYVGGGGDLVVILADDDSAITFANVLPGIVYPIRVKRVLETTTATDLVALL